MSPESPMGLQSFVTTTSLLAVLLCVDSCSAQDILIDDFESPKYLGWTIEGRAFGGGPASGTLPNQMPVAGYRGIQLVNSYAMGDSTVGTMTSEKFTIARRYLAFLIGGGRHEGKTGIELLVDGRSVRTATGHDSEELEWSSWDVSELAGRKAQLRIFDHHTSGWGHINVDHIVQTASAPDRFDLQFQLEAYRVNPDYMNEPLRPQFHFTPEINWMNDPNGLVYHEGEYHLFYQFNPAGNSWGHMSWGHAVSTDLVHWKHLPLAIPETNGVMAFSGCCIVDHSNTSGFGQNGLAPMIAVYTGHGHGRQVQNLAYSNDKGRTWTLHAGNPVLDIGSKDFRDPKVYWHEPTQRWVMVVSMAADKVVVFYESDNLREWKELSRFGPDGASEKPNWECPDLFQLNVENEPGRKLWVLEADMGDGAIAGGSGGEYFVGHFDGSRFQKIQEARWVDFGRDFYAPVSWSNIPKADGRRIWIGWFNNWQTCLIPTTPWRSAMSVPRSLSLRKIDGDYIMIQRPVDELKALRGTPQRLDALKVADTGTANQQITSGRVYELQLDLSPSAAQSGIRVHVGDGEFTEVGYNRESKQVYVDRTKSGNTQFDDRFPGVHSAPARLIEGRIRLHIFVDRSSVEVFINDGEAVISDRVFPSEGSDGLQFFATEGSAEFTSITRWPLDSVWKN